MIGGHYTYAEVPFFEGLFGAERNNYDKLGHFAQGFVPALLAREILLRKHFVNGNHWRNIIIISICLAFSAFYELIEWWVALIAGIDAEKQIIKLYKKQEREKSKALAKKHNAETDVINEHSSHKEI